MLEGLQPHTNLKSLEIQNFLGDQLPSWIAGLRKLVKLEITSCRSCPVMISLRHLPHLLYLKLSDMDQPKGWEEDAEIMTSRPFRKLEELTLSNCSQLSTAPSDFPSLKKLELVSVKHEVVTNICGRVNTTSLKIVGVEQLTCLPSSFARHNKNLASITLSSCPHLTQIVPEICGLSTCLQELHVVDCGELTHLPDDLYTLVSLQGLEISCCSNLLSFPSPQENQRLTSLRFLSIVDCAGLTCLPKQIIESCESLKQLWRKSSQCLMPSKDFPQPFNTWNCLEGLTGIHCLINLDISANSSSYAYMILV